MFSPSPPPSESVPPSVLDGVGGGGALAAADAGINISEKVLQRKTKPASGVGAVATVTSLPQHHLTILSEDMKKQPPPPPNLPREVSMATESKPSAQ